MHSRLAPLPQAQLDRMWNTYIAGEYGGISDSLAALAALRPGGTDYVATAKRFINNAVYQPVAANTDVLDGRHANQHIPQFIGYLRIFEQTGEPEFHAAAQNFWDMVVPHRVYSHGGVGVGEILRARDVIAGPSIKILRTATTPRRARSTTCSSSAGICSSTIRIRST